MDLNNIKRNQLDYILTDMLPTELSERFTFFYFYEFLMTKRKESEHCPDSRTGKSPRHWIPETKSCRSIIRQRERWLTC